MASQPRYGGNNLDRLPPAIITKPSPSAWSCWRGADELELWDPRRMYHLRWRPISVQNGVIVLASYRTIAALYIVGTVLYDWTNNSSPSRYLAYLTNWGIWSTIVHLCVDAMIGICIWSYYRRHQADSSQQQYPKHVRDPFAADTGPELYLDVTPGRWTQHVYRLSLIIFEISISLEILIMCLYWTLLYSGDHDRQEIHVWVNSTVHAVGCCSLLIDLLVGCHRPIDTHSIYVVILAFIYAVVNYIVTKQSGLPLYSVLPWDDANSWVLAIGALLATIVVFFLVSTVAWMRDRLARKGRKACSWRVPRRASALGLDGSFAPGLYDQSKILSATDDDDYESDEDDSTLGWYATEASRDAASTNGTQQRGTHLPLFSPPRFLDTRKGFPCSTCHVNACRQRKHTETFKGWNLLQHDSLPPLNSTTRDTRAFTGTESDARSDTLFPI